MSLTLGIDLGNGKVKFCSIKYSDNTPVIKWNTYSLPFTENRREDFEIGLKKRLNEFLTNEVSADIEDIDLSIFCSSNSFSFFTFSEGISYNAQLLSDIFSKDKIFMISDNGQLFHAKDVLCLTGFDLYKFPLTNFHGSAYLGSILVKNGLSIDIGTTTTDIIPIKNHEIDPDGFKDCIPYIQHRYCSKKISWYGLTITPLYRFISTVPVNKRNYEIVSRDYYTDIIFAILFPQYKKIIEKHAYVDYYPSSNQARSKLAQFAGLDDYLLTPKQIDKIALYVYKKLIKKVSFCIKYVFEKEFKEQRKDKLEIALFALGQELLAKPAIIGAGFNKNNIKTLQIGKKIDLYTASSAYALAVKACVELNGKKVLKDLVY